MVTNRNRETYIKRARISHRQAFGALSLSLTTMRGISIDGYWLKAKSSVKSLRDILHVKAKQELRMVSNVGSRRD
jgi:hypothetical protein